MQDLLENSDFFFNLISSKSRSALLATEFSFNMTEMI